jgi:hypothetical protein
MPLPLLTGADFNKQEARNMVLHLLATAPSSPTEGQVYYHTGDHKWYWHNGTTFKDVTDAVTLAGQAASYYLARANHTGSQTASTISDFSSSVNTLIGGATIAQSQVTNLTGDLAAKAPLASPGLTGTPTAPTATAGTNTTQIATTAYVVAEILARLASNDAMLYKGAIDASTNPNYPAADAGHTYRISVAGKIGGASGANVEAGDIIISHVDGSAGGTQAAVGADWDIIQVNIDGAVTVNGTQTLTNKTINADNNTITNIGSSEVIADIITGQTEETTIAGGDYILIWDASASALRRMSRTNFVAGITGTVGNYSATIGNGASTSYTITQATHGLRSDARMHVDVKDASTGEVVFADISVNNSNGTVTIAFATAPATNAYRVTIIG